MGLAEALGGAIAEEDGEANASEFDAAFGPDAEEGEGAADEDAAEDGETPFEPGEGR